MDTDKTNAGKTPHATGHLSSVALGVLEGCVAFPTRGEIPFRMERRPNDRIGECARLICLRPHAECDMVLIEEIEPPQTYWHGFIKVEGYVFMVRGEREDRRMALQFLDAIQPLPIVGFAA